MSSVRSFGLLTLAILLAGCPELKSSAPGSCSKAYEQCTLDSGVLGVCDSVACSAGESEPCLVCRSQH
jgi:hypothetical protein